MREESLASVRDFQQPFVFEPDACTGKTNQTLITCKFLKVGKHTSITLKKQREVTGFMLSPSIFDRQIV